MVPNAEAVEAILQWGGQIRDKLSSVSPHEFGLKGAKILKIRASRSPENTLLAKT